MRGLSTASPFSGCSAATRRGRSTASDGTSGTYRYTQAGGSLGRTAQPSAVQTGVAASPDGSRVWTVDAAGPVPVYDGRGTQLGTWVAGGATSAARSI